MGRRGRRPHPDILTPREWDVLELLREGLSNPDIAERLGISREAVKYHVSEILSKLGVSTREDAAAWQAAPGEKGPWVAAPLALRLSLGAAAAVVVAGAGVLAWGVLRSDGGGAESPAPSEIPPRADTVAAWLDESQQPMTGEFLPFPLPPCGADWRPSQPLPDCLLSAAPYDPSAPLDTPLNPCEEGSFPEDTLVQEMQRRARIHNASKCVNGWQYEWVGLEDAATAAPTPEPTPSPEERFIRDDGVIQSLIVESENPEPGDSGRRDCIADAHVYVRDNRVEEILQKGRKVRIDIGEEVLSDSPLFASEEASVPVHVYRDETGTLRTGYRECLKYKDCYTDAFVIVYKGAVARVMSQGEGVVINKDEKVRGEADEGPLDMYPVFRAEDGVLEIGSRHCDPSLTSAAELSTSGPRERDFATPTP